ncbi:unnamed protein product [Rotaria socialis]|uniref:Uncharacterized protein n=1 Tax=Rotaria socialis TaxID=392032 RepID=A0A820ABU1_9BILA|nr:unnamed protein product [Rotaria socialis]CAF4173920.1 unnamed protein product [Rotaria socialis]CAF4233348.1 unnamed protein product [Rotaria socialis]CAF4458185.1 unnamed protein product [Rotaria socialis]CAF4473514.1 unnamed protein product [Rotaria socialis]
MDSFYNSNSNHKISQYYLSINNNQKYHRSTSSSSLSLSSISSSLINQSRNLLKKKLNENQYLIPKYNKELDTSRLSQRYNKKRKSYRQSSTHRDNSLSNSASDFDHKNNIDNEENIKNFTVHQTHISTKGTQTDNYSSIRQQYQYGNLRRVNSDLLDYIFISI